MTHDRPRERLLDLGAEALSDTEIIAVLLGTGSHGRPVLTVAQALVETMGSLPALLCVELSELAQLPGVGPSKASRVVAAIELGRRCLTRPLPRGAPVTCSRDVDAALRPRLARELVEHFLAIPLDARNRPIGELRVARGGVTGCGVEPSDVFRRLVRFGAASTIFVHNHPSGVPEPSSDDIALTERLRLAGAVLGVRVLDHIIIGEEGYFSFLDAGFFRPLHKDNPPCSDSSLR